MRPFRPAIFTAAAVAAASIAGVAAAEANTIYVLTVRLANGQVEQIRYVGDTPPQVRMVTAVPASIPFGPGPAFAQMQAMSVAMNQRAAMMLRQAEIMRANGGVGPGGLTLARVSNLPAGAHGVYMVWTANGNGGCARSVQYSSSGPGKTPIVISKTSGDCTPAVTPSVTHDRGPAPAGASPQPVAYHN